MKILLNNREATYDASQLTVRQLLDAMNFTFPMIVVKVNDKLVKREQYGDVLVRDGDSVEAIHLISGG